MRRVDFVPTPHPLFPRQVRRIRRRRIKSRAGSIEPRRVLGNETSLVPKASIDYRGTPNSLLPLIICLLLPRIPRILRMSSRRLPRSSLRSNGSTPRNEPREKLDEATSEERLRTKETTVPSIDPRALGGREGLAWTSSGKRSSTSLKANDEGESVNLVRTSP